MSEINNNPILIIGTIPAFTKSGQVAQLFLTARKVDHFMIEIMLTAVQGPTQVCPWISITHQPCTRLDTTLFLQLLGASAPHQTPRRPAQPAPKVQPQAARPRSNAQWQEPRRSPQPAPKAQPQAARPRPNAQSQAPKPMPQPSAPPAPSEPTPSEVYHFIGEKIGRLLHKDSTPHEVLGISKDASALEIRQAYRALSRKFHPDKNRGEQEAVATAAFKMLNSAYDKLKT